MKRITVRFLGTVQGVGFRFTTCRTAQRFDVTGFVRNLPDGSVEMVAEGADAELRTFLAAVQEAMGGYIRSTAVADSPGTGEFARFDIAY